MHNSSLVAKTLLSIITRRWRLAEWARLLSMTGLAALLALTAACCAGRRVAKPSGRPSYRRRESVIRLFNSCGHYRPPAMDLFAYSSDMPAVLPLRRMSGANLSDWPGAGSGPGDVGKVVALYHAVWRWEALRAVADIAGDNRYHPDCVVFMHCMRRENHAPLLVVVTLREAGEYFSTFVVRMLRIGTGGSATVHCFTSTVHLQTCPDQWHGQWINFYWGRVRSAKNSSAPDRFSMVFASKSGGKTMYGTIRGHLLPSQWQFPRMAFRVRFNGSTVGQGAEGGDMIGPEIKPRPRVICGEDQWSMVWRSTVTGKPVRTVRRALRAEWREHLLPCLNFNPPAHYLVYTRFPRRADLRQGAWFQWYDRNEWSRFPRRPVWPREGAARSTPVWQDWAGWEHIYLHANPSAILFMHGLKSERPAREARHPILVVVSLYSVAHYGLTLRFRIMDPWIHEFGAVWASVAEAARLHVPGGRHGDIKIWAGHVVGRGDSKFRIRIEINGRYYSLMGQLITHGAVHLNGADLHLRLVGNGKLLRLPTVEFRRWKYFR